MLIHIKEPWYSAYKTFGWKKDVWGVGIAKGKVEKAQELGEDLTVQVQKGTYKITPQDVEFYATIHDTKHKTKDGTVLYVVPYTEMTKVRMPWELDQPLDINGEFVLTPAIERGMLF